MPTVRSSLRRRLLALAGAIALIAVGLGVLAPPAAAAPGVNPNAIELTLGAGESAAMPVTVTTPTVPPTPDIVFLADTTGSMQPVLANVSQNIRRIMDEVRDAQPTAQFAVTEYKEERDTRRFYVNTPLTANDDQVVSGTNDWLVNVGGGGAPWTDFINAHYQLGTGAIGFRPNSTRIIAWFGDARSHDPSLGHTLTDTVTVLRTEGARVIAVPLDGTTGGGLDALGQASTLTSGTSGVLLPTTAADQVAQAILDGIRAIDVTVAPQVTSCDPALSVRFDPTTSRVRSGTDTAFTETIAVAAGTEGGDYQCTVDFLVGGVSAGYTQTITVHVPGTPPPVPTVGIGDVTVVEGNAGTTPATFMVNLSEPPVQQVTVRWRTVDGTAVAPGDYNAGSGELVFAPGQTSQPLDVAVVGDAEVEDTESFAVELTGATNATIVDNHGTGTINDDDGGPDPELPQVSIGDTAVTEGDEGTTTAVFTATLDQASPDAVTVPWTTAEGTATPGDDFHTADGTLQFAPGATTAQLDVTVIGDTLDEPDETFTVTLGTPSGAETADDQGTGTILDDDTDGGGGGDDPVVSIGDTAVLEGNNGTGPARFTVRLDTAATERVTVGWRTDDGTATSPADYTGGTGELVVEAGETSATLDVPVVGDTAVEEDETFGVTLTGVAGATIGDGTATGTILDDDGTGGGDGQFRCAASALTLLGTPWGDTANPGLTPCVDDDGSAVRARLGLGLLSVRASGLTAVTDATPAAVSATSGLLTTRISTLGLTIEVRAITATATATCAGGQPVLAGSSSIAELRINGVLVPIGSGRVTLPLVVGTLSLNSTIVAGDTVTQRAFALDTLLGDVVIGESRAGHDGNPC